MIKITKKQRSNISYTRISLGNGMLVISVSLWGGIKNGDIRLQVKWGKFWKS